MDTVGPVAGGAGDRRLMCWFVLVLLVVQRLALPVGGQQVPVTIVGMFLLAGVGLRTGTLVADGRRSAFLGVTLVCLAVVTTGSTARGQDPSVLSLLFIVAIYLPAVCRTSHDDTSEAAFKVFVDAMAGFAVTGLVLFGLQYFGLRYHDYLTDVVPAAFIQRGYNTASPLSYGSEIFRSNGVLFLEPSIFSLFLGLAVVVSLHLSHRLVALPLLLAAMICTASGNGIVLLGVSVISMALFGPSRRKLLLLAAPGVIAGLLVIFTPLGALLAGRSTEVHAPGSSASLRLVEPYQLLLPKSLSTTSSVLSGNGAGSADSYISEIHGSAAVIAPIGPKLLYEYGLFGFLATIAFLLWTFLGNRERLPWTAGLIVVYFVVNASLQQATIAATTYVFLSMLRAPRAVETNARNPSADHSQTKVFR